MDYEKRVCEHLKKAIELFENKASPLRVMTGELNCRDSWLCNKCKCEVDPMEKLKNHYIIA